MNLKIYLRGAIAVIFVLIFFFFSVQSVQATCGIKNIQISASKTMGIGEGEQITITVDFDYQRGANEAFFDWQVKLYEDDYFGDDLMGTNSGSITEPLPLVVHITTTFTVIPSNYVDASEFGIGEIYAEVQAGWELGCIHNTNSDTISIVVCSGFPDCIAYEINVWSIAAMYPDDAGPIYINSLRDYGGVDIERYSGSSLFNKIKNSNLWSSQSFKNKVNSEVIKQLQQKVEEIKCKAVDETQDVEIFINTNELITDDVAFSASDPELYLIFKIFKVFPHGKNQITLKRVGENDYKVSTGTTPIKIHLKDTFDFHPTDPIYAYECQQAGCVHNFEIDVYGVDFEINDLEVTLDSSKMHCDGDPEKIQCCPEGCVNKAELSASLSAGDSPNLTVNSGEKFDVKMTVSNAAGSATANNVAPSLDINPLTGDASATPGGVKPPNPENIPGGEFKDFKWTCTASGEEGGTLKLSASASGTDACSGETVTASSTTSNTVTVEVPEFLFGLLIPLMSSVLIYFSMRGRIKKR